MSAKRRAEDGALDYREDDDDDVTSQVVEKVARPLRSHGTRVTIVPVYIRIHRLGFIHVLPLEMEVNRILYQRTGGKELIQLHPRHVEQGVVRYAEDYPRKLHTIDGVRWIDATGIDEYDQSSIFIRNHYMMVMGSRKTITETHTAPLLILTDSGISSSKGVDGLHSVGPLGFFPFAKLVVFNRYRFVRYRTVQQLQEEGPFTDTPFGLEGSDTQAILHPFGGGGGGDAAAYHFFPVAEYVRRLFAESRNGSVVSPDGKFEMESVEEDQEINKLRVQSWIAMDPRHRDNLDVYPNAPDTAERMGKELLARAVFLDTAPVLGMFAETLRYPYELGRLVDWVIRYTDIVDRQRVAVVDAEAYGGTLPWGLPEMISEYAAGPMLESIASELEEQKKKE
jgi:hypothetical protein